jgi:hypothetical protein
MKLFMFVSPLGYMVHSKVKWSIISLYLHAISFKLIAYDFRQIYW